MKFLKKNVKVAAITLLRRKRKNNKIASITIVANRIEKKRKLMTMRVMA